MRALIEHGDTDINLVDKQGKTPLSYAVVEGHARIVSLFLERENFNSTSPVKEAYIVLTFPEF